MKGKTIIFNYYFHNLESVIIPSLGLVVTLLPHSKNALVFTSDPAEHREFAHFLYVCTGLWLLPQSQYVQSRLIRKSDLHRCE